jgi:hypothetical protein
MELSRIDFPSKFLKEQSIIYLRSDPEKKGLGRLSSPS